MSNVLEATYSESDKCLKLLIPNQNHPSQAQASRLAPYVLSSQRKPSADLGNSWLSKGPPSDH